MRNIRKWWDSRLKAAAFMLAFALLSTSAYGQSHRVASTSLCGDAYLLAIAPDHISSPSWQSKSQLSAAPHDIRDLPQAWDDPEKLIGLDPTHILFGPGEGQTAQPFLKAAGITPIYLKWGEGFETIPQNTSLIADALNIEAPHSPEQLIPKPNQSRLNVLYLSRSGGSAGPGTYVDAVITQAGGNNIIKTPGWVTPDPEFLITLQPDLIVTSFFSDGYESVQAKGVRHKVLTDFMANYHQVDVPGALWPCAGPGLYDAVNIVAQALEDVP